MLAPKFKVGDPVQKVKGEYTFIGTVRSVFYKVNGTRRIVVEMDGMGVLFIADEDSYELR